MRDEGVDCLRASLIAIALSSPFWIGAAIGVVALFR